MFLRLTLDSTSSQFQWQVLLSVFKLVWLTKSFVYMYVSAFGCYVCELPSRYSMPLLFCVLAFMFESWWLLSSGPQVSGDKDWLTWMAMWAKPGVLVLLNLFQNTLEYNGFSPVLNSWQAALTGAEQNTPTWFRQSHLQLCSFHLLPSAPPHACLRVKFAYFQ